MASVSSKLSTLVGRHIEVTVSGVKNATPMPIRGLKTIGGYGNNHETAFAKFNGHIVAQTIGNIEPKSIALTMYRWAWERICEAYQYDLLVTGLEKLNITCQFKHHDPNDGTVVGWVARECVLVEDGGDDDLDDIEMSLVTITLKPTAYERLGVASATSTSIRQNLTA